MENEINEFLKIAIKNNLIIKISRNKKIIYLAENIKLMVLLILTLIEVKLNSIKSLKNNINNIFIRPMAKRSGLTEYYFSIRVEKA